MTANRSLRAAFIALAVLSLAGCATPIGPGSFVDSNVSWSTELGRVIASYVGERCPAPRSTILLIEPPNAQKDNTVTQALTTALLNEGFAVILPSTATPDAHRLQYWVTGDGGEAWVRVQLDNTTAARLYTLDDKKTWVAQSPFTVRN